MADIVASEVVVNEVVVPVAKWTLTKLWQQLGYMCSYKSNLGELNEKVQQLRHLRDGIKAEEENARDASRIINGQVNVWEVKANKLIEDKSFSEGTVAAKAACCNGWLPNLKGRFSLGRKAKKMTLEVDQLLATKPRFIAHPAPHPKVEFPPTEDSTQLGTNFHEGASSSGTSNYEQSPASEVNNIDFESRRSTIEDVMEALRGNQFNLIVICGLGGIGKTTLMGQVHDRAKQEGLFAEYTKATFKESVDEIQIQGELAEWLGLPLEEKERDPRASKLSQRLSQGSKKILVMLDNVWTTTSYSLRNIGIPDSCKVLVTSRQQDVFNDRYRRRLFPIDGLPVRDAWRLFKKTAGSSIESDPEVHVVAERILEECGGLPIAISTVGTALKGKRIAIWKNALWELEKANPENVPGVIEHVYGPINFSYQSLPNEQVKSCLLLCCILEERGNVPVEDLVRDWLGLGLFTGRNRVETLVEGRNRVETLVQTLKNRFLLLDSDKEESVRMHDMVRDVAVYIASEEFEYANRTVVRDTAATVKLMDWPTGSVFEEPAFCSILGVSGLCQLLLLRMKPPTTIFNRMQDLKVLATTGVFWSRVSLESLVPSLAVLTNLQTLRLDNCDFNCDISVIGKLSTLMILSLRGSDIKNLPETFKDLSNLRLLDLTDCRYLIKIAPGVISSLNKLEELYMWNSFQDWVVEKLASTETTNWISQLDESDEPGHRSYMTVETWKRLKSLNRLAVEQPATLREETCKCGQNAEQSTSWANSMDWETGLFRELLSLTSLTTLQVILQPVNILLTTTTLFSKLERFRISIGWERSLYDWELKEQSSNYLRVYDLDVSVAMGSCITKLLEKASHVELKLTQPQLINVLEGVCFAKTKRLKFQDCNDVEHLFNTTTTHPRSSSSAIFPVLHTLEISSASRLKEIFHSTRFRTELRTLKLYSLPQMTYIWKKTNNLLPNMIGHVQVLDVSSCSSLKGIIVKDRVVYDDEEVINFQCLTELTLEDLSSFTGIICRGPEILPEDISPEQSDIPMQPLFDTKVHFPVLTKLEVKGLNFKEIWNNQLSTESFCELKTLKVCGFDNLLHLVPAHMQSRLQKLEYIQAWRCSSLKEIFESKRLIVSNEGDATALTISESGDQGTQINKMVSFKQSRQAFQNLREMSIWRCNSLRTCCSSLKEIFESRRLIASDKGDADQGTQMNKMVRFKQSRQAFQNLTQMSIRRCDSLRTLLSPSVARGLVKLQTLEIEQCEKIEEIVVVAAAAAEGEETEDASMFPQLRTLTLWNLPKLGSFSEGKYNLKWSLVEVISIRNCGNMTKFCSGSLITSNELKIRVENAGESVAQELNDSRQEM